jgi:iron-sulfur cluster insertion protein
MSKTRGSNMSNSAIKITESAASKVWSLMVEEENLDLLLRVYISGGGCSGFQYGFTFEEAAGEDDCPFEQQAADKDAGRVTVIIDPISLQYLEGAEIDYVMDVSGERFVIRNPNAKTTCGCGSSFSA